MPSANKEIAALLYEIADMLDILEVKWEPIAYRKVARVLDSLPTEVSEVYKQGGVKALQEIPGVGATISSNIEEYLKTGRINKIEQLGKKIPEGLMNLMKLEGIGPRKAIFLYKKLKVKTVQDLAAAAKAGKLRNLPGFGEKSEKNILQSVDMLKKSKERYLLGEALPIAKQIVEKLRKNPAVEQAEIAGSTRRGKETVGDLDILVISRKPAAVMEVFTTLSEVGRVLSKGPTKSTVVLKNGLQADLRVLPAESYGAALQYFTGNMDHNVELRTMAIAKGYKLSEYGLFDRKTGKQLAGKTEEEVYKTLGLHWIEPEMRENHGEIEAAAAGKLPALVKLSDIRGDLHLHTNWSDGNHSIEEMALAAKSLGYEYIAITDHSKSEYQAHGMSEERLIKYLKAIEEARKKIKGIKILSGSEVDIKGNGSLDYPDSLLKKLDIVVGSIHSGFKAPEEKITARVLAAMETGLISILGHPTGRLITRRKPFDLDLKKVFAKAAELGVVLEIDSQPNRLDLKDDHIRLAREFDCKFAIDTDSHDKNTFWYTELGIKTARRGWLEQKDVVNTLPFTELKKVFRSTKVLL
ncbi:MAG: DNA polymerase/3'-5' exonuclease PolX [Candidatus Aenigmarchaeota archaeon]|nr:DNA polymerase/3'-5' exonuclease PolX [Candidatus Aenigmarchaeota archaeon]